MNPYWARLQRHAKPGADALEREPGLAPRARPPNPDDAALEHDLTLLAAKLKGDNLAHRDARFPAAAEPGAGAREIDHGSQRGIDEVYAEPLFPPLDGSAPTGLGAPEAA